MTDCRRIDRAVHNVEKKNTHTHTLRQERSQKETEMKTEIAEHLTNI